MAPASVSSPLLAQRAYRQQPHIEAVKGEHGKRYAVVPLLAVEPVGVKALQDLCHPAHKEG